MKVKSTFDRNSNSFERRDFFHKFDSKFNAALIAYPLCIVEVLVKSVKSSMSRYIIQHFDANLAHPQSHVFL